MKAELLKTQTNEYVYDISLDGTFIDAFTCLVEKNTDGFNFELPKKYRPLRLEVIDRIETLKEEIEDMADIVKNEKLSENVRDEEIIDLNNKIKELEQRIVEIIQ